jgi:hypothetical protein
MNKAQKTALMDTIVTRSITNHALHCNIADVEAWAQRCLSGADRTERAAASAAWRADAAADSAASAAARAAARAASAEIAEGWKRERMSKLAVEYAADAAARAAARAAVEAIGLVGSEAWSEATSASEAAWRAARGNGGMRPSGRDMLLWFQGQRKDSERDYRQSGGGAMTTFLIGFACFMVGGFFGVVLTCLLVAGRE